MSDVPTNPHDEGPHEGLIRTPKQLIQAVFFAFVIPIFVIVLLVKFVNAHHRPAAGSTVMTPQAVAERIRPVGRVEIKDVNDIAAMKSGEQVFGAQCTACHAAGVAGAPKVGDAAAWAPRIQAGYPALLNSALKGKGAMGPQGGGDFSDFEIGRAVVYMANQAGAKFEDPKPPAEGASGADAATAAPNAMATPAVAPPPTSGAQAANPGAVAAAVTATAQTAPAPAAPALATTTVAAAAQPATGGATPALYTQACQLCHAAGVAGAPKLGDKAAWAPRLALGVDGLTASAIKGKGAMPPRGGSAGSDADIKAVVTYMVENSK